MIMRRSKDAKALSAHPAGRTPLVLPPAIEKAAQVEAELADARRNLAGAEAEAEAAGAAYEVAANAGHLSEAVAAKARRDEAETGADLARRRVARLDAELQTLLAGAADVMAACEREQLRATAEQAAKEYRAAFDTTMPGIVAQFRGLIRMQALAELACANAETRGASLPAVDGFRHVQGSLRQEIARQEIDLWINPSSGKPFGEADQQLIKQRRDGTGTLNGGDYTHEATHKRRYAAITYLPFSPGEIAPALYEALLPCIHASSPAGWSPLKAGTSPKNVLAALDALEAREAVGASVERAPAIEIRAIEPARDVRLNPDPAPYREYRGPYGSDLEGATADALAGED